MNAIALIPNIGPLGAQRRLRLGIVAFAGAALLAVVFFWLGAPRAWRLVLFAPLWLGAVGLFQARHQT